ncbi:MAG: hypothetical protein INQ03_17160 [Candidatus Heimdallarchaeota archaeon]|nr:hypothetical protein [Candidatus Heimdallarchaeota archaeon]
MELPKLSYLIGGYYDYLLAIMLFFFHEQLFPIFDFVVPEEKMFIRALALFLAAVGYMLIKTADKAREFAVIGYASAAVRFGYVLLVVIRITNIPWGFILLAVTDGITGLLIVYALYFAKSEKD